MGGQSCLSIFPILQGLGAFVYTYNSLPRPPPRPPKNAYLHDNIKHPVPILLIILPLLPAFTRSRCVVNRKFKRFIAIRDLHADASGGSPPRYEPRRSGLPAQAPRRRAREGGEEDGEGGEGAEEGGAAGGGGE